MRLKVSGMTCGHCEKAVERAIGRLGGTARVDLAAGTVEVAGVEDAGAVRRAIEEEGYVVEREGLDHRFYPVERARFIELKLNK